MGCEDAEPSNTIQREDHRPKTCPCTDQCEIKPNCSYSSLIVMAIQSSQEGKMSLNMIYDFISKKFPYYGHMQDKSGWQAFIRHNLSVHKKLFVHETRDRSSVDPHCRHRQGGFWSLSPNADVDKILTKYRRFMRPLFPLRTANVKEDKKISKNFVQPNNLTHIHPNQTQKVLAKKTQERTPINLKTEKAVKLHQNSPEPNSNILQISTKSNS